MRVLITGCDGQVGSCLVEQLSNKAIIKAVNRESLDITIYESVHSAITGFKPDIIINAAAYTAVDKAEVEVESNLAYKTNKDGPENLALAANKIGVPILHISTDYVFPGDKLGQYNEMDQPNPQCIYGKSKLAGEEAVINANQQHIILRTSWVFGEKGNNFVKTMLKLGRERDKLSVVGDQLGGPTYAGDIAKVLILFAEKLYQKQNIDFGIYHFSGLPYVSWYDFALEIFKCAKKNDIIEHTPKVDEISTEEFPTPAVRPKNSKLNISKISNALGVEASDWCKAIEAVVCAQKDNTTPSNTLNKPNSAENK